MPIFNDFNFRGTVIFTSKLADNLYLKNDNTKNLKKRRVSMEIILYAYDRCISLFETWSGLRRNTSLHCNNSVKQSNKLCEKDIICVEEIFLFYLSNNENIILYIRSIVRNWIKKLKIPILLFAFYQLTHKHQVWETMSTGSLSGQEWGLVHW